MISLIVAVSENGVIGRDGGLPWRLSSDLRRFRRLTMGHHVIMGRKTYQSLTRPLPGRTLIVISRQTDFNVSNALVAHDLEQAVRLAAADSEVFVIGGGEIYRQALSLVDRIYLTLVHVTIDGDTRFPQLNPADWKVVEETPHAADGKNQYDTTFRILNRMNA